MKRFSVLSVMIVFLMMFAVSCDGKSTGLEGKVVDGKGQPLASVKVSAKMSQPIKGYEQFETKTGSDGSFKFSKLFPTSEYQLIFYSERWLTEKKIKTESGPKGETKILPDPVTIRFMDPKKGVVFDTRTGLMWAAEDGGGVCGMNWPNAKSYCDNYRGGGYTDWRMPSHEELAGLYAVDGLRNIIALNCLLIWAAETAVSPDSGRGPMAAEFDFTYGTWNWSYQTYQRNLASGGYGNALPVRSVK